jgi:hypothetical protein
MVTIRQVQNAGYWISRDALMAENIVVDNQTPSSFLVLTWIEWSYDKKEDSTYHSVTYSIEVLPDEIPKIWREHSISMKVDDEYVETESKTNLVAEHIYYNSDNLDDPDNPYATYDTSVLTVQITSSLGEASETREYRVLPRPDF